MEWGAISGLGSSFFWMLVALVLLGARVVRRFYGSPRSMGRRHSRSTSPLPPGDLEAGPPADAEMEDLGVGGSGGAVAGREAPKTKKQKMKEQGDESRALLDDTSE